MKTSRVLGLVAAFMLMTFSFGTMAENAFYFGVDLSYVNEVEDCGAVYFENGQQRDPFALFADYGANLVRARLWHNPDWTEYSTLADVKRTFERAVDAGMNTLLDFHYSDNWADPGRQEIPTAWQDIKETQALADTLYQYTYDVLTELHTANLTPTFVQVGNETNSGMLKAEGEDLNWARQTVLFNAGIRAVRDFSAETGTNPQIVLHVAQPENTGWWFAEAELAGITDFDVIGISYYPQWSTFSIADMGAQVSYLRQRFGKAVMVVETAYGWTRDMVNETAGNILNQGLRGYPFSPEGQRRFMTDLTQSLISNGALGVVYWEPAWVSTTCTTRWGQGSHWENATFFDFQNNNELLEGVNFLNHAYIYPTASVFDAPWVEDDTGDVLEGIAALDLLALHAASDADTVTLRLSVDGDVYDERGNYLFYFDTTHDSQGATDDVSRRPITVAPPYQPEFRLDVTIREERGTVNGSVSLHAWINGDWEDITFTGRAAIVADDESTIELVIPRVLLNHPQVLYVGVVSTDNARAHTAADIVGTSFTPPDWDTAVVLDTFFEYPLSE